MLYVILRFLKSQGQILFSPFFPVYHIFRGTNRTATLSSSPCQAFCFGGLPLLTVIFIFCSHDWQINVIMCRAKNRNCELRGSFRNPRFIPWDTGWNQSWTKILPWIFSSWNDLRWISSWGHKIIWGMSDSSSQALRAPNESLRNQWKILRPI